MFSSKNSIAFYLLTSNMIRVCSEDCWHGFRSREVQDIDWIFSWYSCIVVWNPSWWNSGSYIMISKANVFCKYSFIKNQVCIRTYCKIVGQSKDRCLSFLTCFWWQNKNARLATLHEHTHVFVEIVDMNEVS